MMTTWVVLHRLPLTYTQIGPCLIVNSHDVALYNYDVHSGQSNARIVLGEQICEGMLLRGLLVHSAGDYAELLMRLTGWSQATFVRVMNLDAKKLGMRKTHYVDLTGIGMGDRSTAQNQATLAVTLMANDPIVDQIVTLPQVSLPYAGIVGSFTPLIGTNGVVGVKSGFTNEAGGCDVMAVKMIIGNDVVLTYAVVLGQFGADPLGVAGNSALALTRSLRPSIARVVTAKGIQVEWVGSRANLVKSFT
jgi:D-alanyl-D-alanine carboxypeptidase (penicillin-binding protein 5/6)